jgi:hypothetical protein
MDKVYGHMDMAGRQREMTDDRLNRRFSIVAWRFLITRRRHLPENL